MIWKSVRDGIARAVKARGNRERGGRFEATLCGGRAVRRRRRRLRPHRVVTSDQVEHEAYEAFAPVLRDVAATTDLGVTIECKEDEAGPVVVVSTAGGARWNVRIHGDSDSYSRIETATQEVQELVIEELWRHGSNWPVCPKHPTTHPMELKWMLGGPWWSCPADGATVASLGSLTR